MSSEPVTKVAYIPAIDGLRGIAILGAMSTHGVDSLMCVFGEGGWFSVNIFFVMSGFLITRLALAELAADGKFNTRQFYFRRILRICPALWLLFAFYALVNPFQLLPSFNMVAIAISAANLADYDLALKWGHILNSGLEFCWSVGVEEKFYALFPLIMLFCYRFQSLAVLAVILLLLQGWRMFVVSGEPDVMRLSMAFDTRCSEIIIGCFAASLLTLKNRFEKAFALLAHPLSSIIPFAIIWYWMRCVFQYKNFVDPAVVRPVWLYLIPLLGAAVALLLMSLTVTLESGKSNFLSRFLSSPIMVWLGKVSYGMYLWQAVAILYTSRALGKEGIISDVVKVFLTIFLASLSYVCVERRFLALKKNQREITNSGSACQNS